MINKPSLDYTPLGIITTPTMHVGSRLKPSYYSSSWSVFSFCLYDRTR